MDGKMVQQKMRWYYLDNIKFFLILCVVLGHAVNFYVDDSLWMRKIWTFVYIYHMPMFIFISGFLSKGTINHKIFRVEKVISYLVLYTLFIGTIYITGKFLFHQDVKFVFFRVQAAPWYLLAMVIFLGVTFLLKDIKPIYVVVVSVIIGLVVGYAPSVKDFLALSRVFVFYPFFYIGYYLSREKLEHILYHKDFKYLKYLSISALILVMVFVLFKGEMAYRARSLLVARWAYKDFIRLSLGWVVRLGWYCAAAVMSLGFLYLIPKKKTFFSGLGARTLQVYVLHAIVLRIAKWSGFERNLIEWFPQSWQYLVLIGTVLLTIILALPIFEWPFKKITAMKLTFLTKEEALK